MTSYLYIALCLVIVLACVKPLGAYMARVYMGERTLLHPVLGWFESLLYRLCKIDPETEMSWRGYAAAILIFNLLGGLLLFFILLLQGVLPFNPQRLPGVDGWLALNISVSFLTNTDWQSYSPETTLSYFSQAIGIAVQHFLSAACGLAVAVALFRGLARKQAVTIGNAWADIIRGLLYVLLPLSFIFALLLASQGVIQNFSAYTSYSTIETHASGLIAQGPAASQIAIKMLGSNGGGFFTANGAHPFENPTPFANLLEMVAILLIPAAILLTFGIMVGDRRQGWMMMMAMTAVLIPMMVLTIAWEGTPNPLLPEVVDQSAGNMEGKEVRIGATASAAWTVLATTTSNGSASSAYDSLMPLSGLAPMLLIQFGEVIFGGVGVGIYGMLMYVLIAVFMGGLMVGRTPEFLGKKIGVPEIKIALLIIIIPPTMTLFGTALAVATEAGRAGAFNPGAQGFSELHYAFASVSNNNGSALAGIQPYSRFFHILLALCMAIGRFGLMVLALAIAGALAAKNTTPPSVGTLPTHTPLFAFLLVSVILLNSLTYIPAIALGPVAEHVHLFPPDEEPL